MRMLFKAGLAILALLACFLVVHLWGAGPRYGNHVPPYPEFSITLVDNYENDFVWIKYGAGWGWDELDSIFLFHPEQVRIKGALVENNQKTFDVGLPHAISENDNVQIFLNMDVLERGKVYLFEFWYVPYAGTPGPVYSDELTSI